MIYALFICYDETNIKCLKVSIYFHKDTSKSRSVSRMILSQNIIYFKQRYIHLCIFAQVPCEFQYP